MVACTWVATMVCDVEVVLDLASQTPLTNHAVIASGTTVGLGHCHSRAWVVDHNVIWFTSSAIRRIHTSYTKLWTCRACKRGCIEVEIRGQALEAHSEVETHKTVEFARLTGQPRKGNVESPHGTRCITIGVIVVLFTLNDAVYTVWVPFKTAVVGRAEGDSLSEQGIVFSEIDAGIVDEYETIDAKRTVGRVEAGVAADITGEADVDSILVCLGFAHTSTFIKLIIIVCRAVIGVIGLYVAGTVAVDGTEVNSSASRQAGQTVSRTVTCITSCDRLSTVLANGAAWTIKTSYT